LYFPVNTGASADAPGPGGTKLAPARGDETILVVDDDDALRELVRDILKLGGYSVVEAPDGDAALGLLARREVHIDGVITDVVMPKIGGPELAGRLAADGSRLPMLYMSGYVGESVEALTGGLPPGAAFIQKPFTPDALVRRLREVLDAAPGGSGR
jgi:CheY-like chemotaxis protein